MDILKRLNDGVKELERNLRGKIDFDRAARLSCMPKDSFLRLFSYMTGMTAAQYIRRRRLTLAVTDLRQSDDKILDIALRYGYDSGDAFTRAFTRQHGVTPQRARREDVRLKLYQPLSFSVAVRGAREMDFRLVDVEDGPVFGFLEKLNGQESGEKRISEIWNRSFPGGQRENLIRKTIWYGIWKDGRYALSKDNGTVWYGFWKEGRYTIVPTESHGGEDSGFSLAKGRYAVFGAEPGGTAWEAVPELRESILEDWLPSSGYALKPGPFFEIYHLWTDWEQRKKVRYCEIWMPLTKQAREPEKSGDPLISVLIPVYQAEEYLARCVDSVLAQTYPNVEIVLVDDGSTDNSPKVAARYAKRPNVRFYQEEHHGVSYARQKLIERARGEYFFFLDSDDYIDTKTLEILYGLLIEHHADIVQCRQGKDWQSMEDKIDYDKGKSEFYEKEDMITRLCCGSGPLRGTVAGKLCRKEVFRGVLFPIGKIHEVEFAMPYILENCQRVVCTDLPLYRYFYNPNSLTKKGFSYEKYDVLDVAADRYQFCKERGLDFAADMACFWYAWKSVELYRDTYEKISETDQNLKWLGWKCHCACQYLLTKDYFDDRTRAALSAWRDDPLQGEHPWYRTFWSIAEEIYNERNEKK